MTAASVIIIVMIVVVLSSRYIGPTRVSGATAYAGSEYTLADFPEPFIKMNSEGIRTSVLIPSSSPHGPSGSAHTMDTMGGVLIAYTLGVSMGRANVTDKLATSLDSYNFISTYDTSSARVTMQDVTSNLIVIGGPGVNQVAYYYNELRDAEWKKVLPVVYERDAQGDYLYVQSSGSTYRIQRDGQGRISSDYGVIEIFRDGVRYVLLVYGLGGEGTRVAAEALRDYKMMNLTGRAAVIRYSDSNGDGFLDIVSVVENVEAPTVTVEIYSDETCTVPLTSITWGSVEPGGSSTSVIFVKNLGDRSVRLYLNTQGWDPSDAAKYIRLSWNCTGTVLEPSRSIPALLTLNVLTNATGVSDFSFQILITAEG
jgi:hypothetical protein